MYSIKRSSMQVKYQSQHDESKAISSGASELFPRAPLRQCAAIAARRRVHYRFYTTFRRADGILDALYMEGFAAVIEALGGRT